MKRNILVYRDHLLPPSETFIRAQGEALTSFTPYYVGSRLVDGISVPLERTFVINDSTAAGRLREALFKVTGFVHSKTIDYFRSLKPHLLHAHFGPDGVLSVVLARKLNIPLVVTFHGYDATVTDECARRSHYTHRLYLRRKDVLKCEARLFIAVSNFIRSKLIGQGFPGEKIVVHYIGIDTSIFAPDDTITREPVVLFVGRLVENKGCAHLIQAMAKVQAEIEDARLVVIGDGPLRPELQKMAQKKLRKHHFCFLGSQPHNVVREWMNKARVFSVPSVKARSGASEGFGLVFAEAQAMGLPVVSFATGGIPEAVDHGTTGLLVPEGEWELLAKHICRLFRDNELWHKFSLQGQNRARHLFDLNKQTRALEQLYEGCIRGLD